MTEDLLRKILEPHVLSMFEHVLLPTATSQGYTEEGTHNAPKLSSDIQLAGKDRASQKYVIEQFSSRRE